MSIHKYIETIQANHKQGMIFGECNFSDRKEKDYDLLKDRLIIDDFVNANLLKIVID